ncbi:conserved hypothetical protein [Neospora caninum Liverpool]|uniref:Uncharacterized protein n=1 Tax=Neospora caninum (strain Liverpool) TaxID=572307 RepID=F0VH31_NEOCL|nr:conserved hypothetical protein [Neospora caninum Liverpool]CBZ53025.1 conserved hypothetical protein [Neospora caninum Liverpool]CEL67009.1 TPA: hypothetical protein BN1204_028140 [Neospora caninum Liverpool]|eukprot:XP_003883057.1 conserved hypothetical protein [Neospora caninum Liverpool]
MPDLLSKTILSALVLACLRLCDFESRHGRVDAVRQDQSRYRYASKQNGVFREEPLGGVGVGLDNRLSPQFLPSFVHLTSHSASEADEEEESGGSAREAEDENDGDEKDGDFGDGNSQSKSGDEGSSRSEDGDKKSEREKGKEATKGGEKKQEGSDSESGTEKHQGDSGSHQADKDHDTGKKGSGQAAEGGKKDEKQPEDHDDQKDENGPNEHDREKILSRLTKLLSNASGHALLGRLHDVLTEHEKQEALKAAEEAKKKEEEDAKKKEEALATQKKMKDEAENAMKAEIKREAPAKDLLLTQQLNALWMLPFIHDQRRVETCLSGFEKLAGQSRIVCRDPACMRLERDRTCAFLDVQSIDRAPEEDEERRTIYLGFDPSCRDVTQLGKRLLDLLQHPVKQHEMEQRLESVGTGAQVPSLTNHLDLVCEGKDPVSYPTCTAVSQALRNVPHLGPKNLPSMVVLADIADIPNTLGLYRVVAIFEGRVPFADDKGHVLDKNGARVADLDAGKFLKKLHTLER